MHYTRRIPMIEDTFKLPNRMAVITVRKDAKEFIEKMFGLSIKMIYLDHMA